MRTAKQLAMRRERENVSQVHSEKSNISNFPSLAGPAQRNKIPKKNTESDKFTTERGEEKS